MVSASQRTISPTPRRSSSVPTKSPAMQRPLWSRQVYPSYTVHLRRVCTSMHHENAPSSSLGALPPQGHHARARAHTHTPYARQRVYEKYTENQPSKHTRTHIPHTTRFTHTRARTCTHGQAKVTPVCPFPYFARCCAAGRKGSRKCGRREQSHVNFLRGK